MPERRPPIPSISRGGLGWGWGKFLNLLATTFPHPPPSLPLVPQGDFLRGKGGGEDGADLCAYGSLEGGGEDVADLCA